ncbi:MAG: hypothetical protein ABL982_09900 [Vicinamibacterales bacterium]
MNKPVEERRKLLKTLIATGAAVGAAATLPDAWKKPIVNAIEVPLHAQSSVPPSFINTISFAYTMNTQTPISGTVTPGTTPRTHLTNQVLPGSTFDIIPTVTVNAGTTGTFTLAVNEVTGGGDATNFNPASQPGVAPGVNGVVPFASIVGDIDNAQYVQYSFTVTPSNPAYPTYFLQVTFDMNPAGPTLPA